MTATAQNHPSIVAVKTMYGDRFYVRAADLDIPRMLLRLQNPVTGQPIPSSGDLSSPLYLHRENICRHPKSEFTTRHALGDHWSECPTCRADVDNGVAALIAKAA